MAISHYRELITWQKAMDLVVEVYRRTRSFPTDELYALTTQVRKAAVSVPSNIAEGQGRGTAGDFGRFLLIANGSRQEVETQMLIALRLGYINQEALDSILALASEVGRLISGLNRSIAGN
jgi:four helix bundle protein